MATGGKSQQLTNRQVTRLASAISADDMESIAQGYMDISPETVKNIWRENQQKAEAFNRAIIRLWANKNPADQVESLADLLCKAAECGYVDPHKVQQILGVTTQKMSVAKTLLVTHDWLDELAQYLRPYVAGRMKMEPAPWIKDYVVGMEELYTELTLEKIDGRLFDEIRRNVDNYEKLFVPGMLEYVDIRYYHPRLYPPRKILAKGDPGMGKTSLSKKIAYDWATGFFEKVSIVFYVSLKLVKPSDLVEDVILRQNPTLEGKHLTKQKLTEMLDNAGSECLLILDGLDECALGVNNDVIKIITGAKFFNLNVLLTSRPHTTREVEGYFHTIVSVEGFTRSEARKFASRIVDDEKKVEAVLDFNPAGERDHRPVHNVPILLSFLCLLTREEQIDLSDKTIRLGEIYFRMVRCLYKKFTIRKNIEFQTNSFLEVVEMLGKLALDTLLSENPLLRRSEIVRQVSTYVFDYGLLIGHEDFRLLRDETADIFLAFPHRSLQEFLAAFYFVLSLGKRQTVKDLDKAIQEVLKNPLFTEFCLWFLDESNRFYSFPERSIAREQLSSYVSEQIDAVKVNCLELEKKYHVLHLALNSEMKKPMFDLAFTKCRKIKHLVIHRHHFNRIMRYLQPVTLERLKLIEVGDLTEFFQPRKEDAIRLKSPLLFVRSYNDRNTNIEVRFAYSYSENVFELLDIVLKFTECWRRSLHLRVDWYLHDHRNPPLSCVLWQSVHHLDFNHSVMLSADFLFWMLKKCPKLVKLFLKECFLESDSLVCLALLSSKGRLRKLSTLDISNNYNIGGKLEKLLCSNFESPDTLLLNSCFLTSHDLASLARASATGRLSKLSTLDISNSPHIAGNLSVLFCSTSFPSLHSLFLSRCKLNRLDISSLIEAREQAMPQLKNLDMSFNFNPHSSSHSNLNLSPDLLCILPRLNTLVVRGCWLEYFDLYHMYQRAIKDGHYFSELTTLDMTLNPGIAGYLSLLIYHYFPNLSILVLRGCGLNSYDLISLAQASNQGRLPQLRHLDISQNCIGWESGGLVALFTASNCFPLLINLILCDCHLNLQELCCLTQARLDGKLPRIKHLDISLNGLSDHVGILSRDPITQREISWGNVICCEEVDCSDDSSSDESFSKMFPSFPISVRKSKRVSYDQLIHDKSPVQKSPVQKRKMVHVL